MEGTAWPLIPDFSDAFTAYIKYTPHILQRYCEQEASPDGDLMSQAKILRFSEWLVDGAVQQIGYPISETSLLHLAFTTWAMTAGCSLNVDLCPCRHAAS